MEVAKLKATITLDDKEFQAGARRSEQSLKEIGEESEKATGRVSKFGNALSKIDTAGLHNAGNKLSMGLTVPLVGLGTAAVKAAMDMNSLKAGLTAVAGSSAEADRQLGRLAKIAELPGLGMKEAVQGSIRLQAAGMSAGMAERSMKAFGNAIATVGGGKAELEGVNLALGQIASKSKVSAEEINQINERVPQIRQAMIKAFGTADTEQLSKMGIDSKRFINDVVGELEKLPAVAGGAKNSLETASDSINMSLAKIGEKGLPLVAKGAELAATTIDKLSAGFDKLPDAGQNAVLTIVGIGAAAGPATKLVAGLVDMLTKLKVLQIGSAGASAAAGATTMAGGTAATAGAGAAAGLGARGALMGAARFIPHVAAVGFGLGAGNYIQENLLPDSAERKRQRRKLDVANASLSKQHGTREKAMADRKAKGLPYYDANGKVVDPKKEATTTSKPFVFNSDEDKNRAGDAKFQSSMAMAGVQAGALSKEDNAARMEAAQKLPLLKARQEALTKQAAALKPMIAESAKAEAEYYQLLTENAGLIEQSESLKAAASKEVADNQKKARETAEKAAETARAVTAAGFALVREQAAVWAASAPDEKKAATLLQATLPIIERQKAQVAAEAKSLVPRLTRGSEEEKQYLELQTKYWQLQGEGEQLKRAAQDEQKTHFKKASDAAKKNLEGFKQFIGKVQDQAQDLVREAQSAFSKANNDRLGLAGARVSLAEAQLKNMSGDPRAKQRALEPLLIKQFQEQSRAVQGESELDRIQRLTNAEGLKSKLVEGMDPRRREIALRQLGGIQQQAEADPFQSRALAEAQRAAAAAQKLAPAPVVQQFIVQGPMTMQKLWEAYQQFQRQQNSASGLIGSAG